MSELHAAARDYGFERDFKGYGEPGLEIQWPNDAKIAVSFVINYEEGGEHSILHNDPTSEPNARENPGIPPRANERDYMTESEYEYGSRAGFWRLFRLFNKHGMKFTVYAVGQAAEANPEVIRRCVEEGHDVASHAYRWIDYHDFSVEQETEHIKKAVMSLEALTGYAPRGWYAGRPSPQSRALVPKVYREMGKELEWYSDTYADDIPYWTDVPSERGMNEEEARGLMMLPYSYDCNDFKFHLASGFSDPGGFLTHLKNAFDVLYEEGTEGMPKMMTVGLHCRIVGRPGRFKALQEFVEYIRRKERVWVATRTEIARAFKEQYPYKVGQLA